MKHRTTNCAIRASHIAEREAKKVYASTHDFTKSLHIFEEIYHRVLREFQKVVP